MEKEAFPNVAALSDNAKKITVGTVKETFPNVFGLKSVMPYHVRQLKLALSPHGVVRKSGYVEPKAVTISKAVKGIVKDPTIQGSFTDIGKQMLNLIAQPGQPVLI